MKFSDDIQKLLPLGYIYLVILGILKESLFYYQFGINILKYSTIMDILISPIAYLVSNPIIPPVITAMIIFHFYLPNLLSKNNHKKWVQKLFELKSTEGLSIEESKSYYNTVTIKTLAMIFLSFFVGTGIGEGYFKSKEIKNNKLHYDYTLNYNSGESEQIHLINTNSIYYFYITKGSKTVKIAPIGTIKNIELTTNKILTEK